MDQDKHYAEVHALTEKAISRLEFTGGNYKDHTGSLAVSMLLEDKYGIKIADDEVARRAFQDAWENRGYVPSLDQN